MPRLTAPFAFKNPSHSWRRSPLGQLRPGALRRGTLAASLSLALGMVSMLAGLWPLASAQAQILPSSGAAGSASTGFSSSKAGPAAFGDWVEAEQSRWRWVAASEAVGDQDSLLLGLETELQPGWKIYWRSPGDAGLPPKLTPEPDSSLSQLDMNWPVPHRFQTYGIDTFGYKEHVLFPVRAAVADPGQPQRIHTNVSFLICEEICVPGKATVGLDLPAGPASPSFEAPLIEEALLMVPDQGQRYAMGLTAVSFVAGPKDAMAPVLTLQVSSREALSEALDAFVEAPQGWRFERPQITFADEARSAVLRMQGSPQFASVDPLGLEDLAVTVADGLRAFEAPTETLTLLASTPESASLARQKPTPPGALVAAGASGGLTLLLTMLGTALLGGFILNLMPCVLPVLSLKVLSVVKAQSMPLHQARLGFLATAVGIIFSFLLLGAGAIALKLAGTAVGWGMQFQQPLFLLFMIALLIFFALNLVGLFELPLPAALAGLGNVGTGASGASGQSLIGHFFTGAFATLLATPCSAPFLGTALGFALTRGSGEILLIFAVLGLGMAAPYLLIAAFPGVARVLPKPGGWMLWLKAIMGLALLGTAIWLLSVLQLQLGWAASLTAAAMIVVAAGLFALRLLPRLARLPALVPSLPLVALLALPTFFSPIASPDVQASSKGYVPFNLTAVEASVQQGQTVFVDVTAQWCVTCKINKLRVLETDEARALFAKNQVQMQQADWTNHSDEIANYLASFQRFGIPFNVVYGPSAPSGIVLPELLSYEAVERAITQAL